MKYKITLNNKVYEIEVERGDALVVDEYPAPAASVPSVAPAPVAVASAPVIAPAPVIVNTPTPATATAPIPVATPVQVAGEKVTAPLPGTILEIVVNVGDKVKAGQNLVVIEAMKMENEISSPIDGVVVQILTFKGAAVNSGDGLIVIG